mmetsp:Transcript_1140/g.1492  ORF Transcript_1140/g.1492 Transcript_1140/m.1492 type:complete len:259 (+) Transcript_1140:1971-2747(+)
MVKMSTNNLSGFSSRISSEASSLCSTRKPSSLGVPTHRSMHSAAAGHSTSQCMATGPSTWPRSASRSRLASIQSMALMQSSIERFCGCQSRKPLLMPSNFMRYSWRGSCRPCNWRVVWREDSCRAISCCCSWSSSSLIAAISCPTVASCRLQVSSSCCTSGRASEAASRRCCSCTSSCCAVCRACWARRWAPCCCSSSTDSSSTRSSWPCSALRRSDSAPSALVSCCPAVCSALVRAASLLRRSLSLLSSGAMRPTSS